MLDTWRGPPGDEGGAVKERDKGIEIELSLKFLYFNDKLPRNARSPLEVNK